MVHKVMAFKHIKVSNKRTKSSVFHDTGRIMESNCNKRDTGKNSLGMASEALDSFA